MKLQNPGNYKIFLLSSSVLSFGAGLFLPFWIIFVQKVGGSIEQFGFAMGLLIFAEAIASYFIGKYSDKLGRKPFLIFAVIFDAVVVLAYTFIITIPQLLVLQVINGVASGMLTTLETTFLGDITKKISRGTDIGKYRAITVALIGIATMFGGVIAGQVGIKVIFYIVSALIFVAALILFFIKE